MEQMIDELDSSITELKTKYYGVVTGSVVNVADPLFLGRVQVKLEFNDGLDLSAWARVAVPMAGLLHGHYFMPNIGDEVLVAFEHGDISAPYVIGSLWNAAAPPPLASPVPQIRSLRTPAGNQIVFTEAPPSITIQSAPNPPAPSPAPPSAVGPNHTLMLSPAGVQIATPTSIALQVGATVLLLTPEGVTIQAGGSVITMGAAGVSVASPTAVSLTGAAQVSIKGATVAINEPA